MTSALYTARCASSRNPDWPLWFVADEAGQNVTNRLWRACFETDESGFLCERDEAEILAVWANSGAPSLPAMTRTAS